MSGSKYTELNQVQKPAIRLFSELGWQTQECSSDPEQPDLIERETLSEVILKGRLTASLIRLNSELKESAIDEVIKIICSDRQVEGVFQANKTLYSLLKNGIKVEVLNEQGDRVTENVRLVDWGEPEKNDFFLVSEFTVMGKTYKRRADLVGFLNGIPLLFIEFKASHKRVEDAFNNNLRDYKDNISQLFWYNAMVILSNGSESRLGTITSAWDHFASWKRINSEGEQGIISLDTMIRATCQKSRFLDLIENYILYRDDAKIIAKNHQYLGVENAVQSFSLRQEKEGKIGVFWHTQGSGKSFSMIFFAQKILRKFPGNYTFLIVTDRNDLDGQIYKNFSRCEVFIGDQGRAETVKDLRQLLKGDSRYIFTTIQKFQTRKGEVHPLLSERDDIIVMTDEAHRSQYEVFAHNMRVALPNANFIGFTGTPLISVSSEKTKQVFGDYISKYNFKQAIEDGATVPLYYENRKPELEITNGDFKEEIERLVDESDLTEEEEEKFEKRFAQTTNLLTQPDRLDEVAQDIA